MTKKGILQLLSSTLLTLVVSVGFANSAPPKNNALCQVLLSAPVEQVTVHSIHDKIATPASLPQVVKMQKTLETLRAMADQQNNFQGQIYQFAKDVLIETHALGQEIIDNHASDQDQVFDYFAKAIGLVDFSTTVTNAIGYLADGFGSVFGYNEAKLKKRLTAYRSRYFGDKTPLSEILIKFLEINKKHFLKPLQAKKKTDLKHEFEMITIFPDTEIPNTNRFKFQHQYIFADGVLSIQDLFRNRETGISYLGASTRDRADYDGFYGDAEAFLRHDQIHAFVSKYFDQVLFQQFGAKSIADMSLLKSRTNSLLQKRIQEYEAITDADLRLAVEALLFMFLHEQARTYPMGIDSDFANPSTIKFYKDEAPKALRDRLGAKYAHLAKKSKVLTAAFLWIKTRAEEDARDLRALYPN